MAGTEAQVRQTKKMKFLIRTGVFLGYRKKWKEVRNLQNQVFFSSRWNKTLEQNPSSRNFKLSNLKLTSISIKQPPKKAKFLRKNHAHLFGCQLWWFCFVWTNFAPPAHFKCFREAKFFLNNIVAPALWFFRTLHHEGWCVEQGLAFSWSMVITSFPRNARDRFSLMTQRLLNENARLGLPRRTLFEKTHVL